MIKAKTILNKPMILLGVISFVNMATAYTGSMGVGADTDTRDYTLAVSSSHGSPDPVLGTHSNYCWHSSLLCSVESRVPESGTNYTCTGWAGSGDVPASGGASRTDVILLTELESSIDWGWNAQALIQGTDGMAVNTDTRDYSLAVSSSHGSPDPVLGTHSNYCWHSSLLCSVESRVPESETNYTCTGWAGSGDVPASGGASRTDVILLTELESSIDWGWDAQALIQGTDGMAVNTDTRDYTLSVTSAHGSPSPAVGTVSNYCWHSTLLCSVESRVPESGTNYACTGWAGSGDVPASGGASRTDSILLTEIESSIDWGWLAQVQVWSQGADAVIENTDTRDYSLTINSAHGSPIPSHGTHSNYCWHSTVSCSVVASEVSGQTKWESLGWDGTGSAPSFGNENETEGFVLTELESSVIWNWETLYWLDIAVSGSGSTDTGSGWRQAGKDLWIGQKPDPDWLFTGWSGDVSGDYTQDEIFIPMTHPVLVIATFSDDADNDGLLNTDETALGTDPHKKDSDDDGMIDPDELVAGTSPINTASVLKIALHQNGLINELSWFGVNGRYYQLEFADTLNSLWHPIGKVVAGNGSVEWVIDDSKLDPKRFYRVQVSTAPENLQTQ